MSRLLDAELMDSIVEGHFATATERRFGEVGVAALREVLVAIRKFYQHVAPERLKSTLVVFQRVEASSTLEVEVATSLRQPRAFVDFEELASALTFPGFPGAIVIEPVREGGGHGIWAGELDFDPADLSTQAIVYLFRQGAESFFIAGELREVPNPCPALYPSALAIPTFRELEAALADYKARAVRHSSCPIFRSAWSDDAQMILKNRPEAAMRSSLAHFLNVQLGANADVFEETMVDAAHPVDIHIAWQMTNSVALIELKWMGDSWSASGRLTQFREQRARDGADQLAEYLDKKAVQSPQRQRAGYLVVVDARRAGITERRTIVTVVEAGAFRHQEINFYRSYTSERADFAEPIRMFAEAVASKCNVEECEGAE